MTMQGIAAVIIGFVGMAVLVMAGTAVAARAMGRSGAEMSRPPPGYLAIDLALGLVAALAGGALTGWLAPSAPLMHGYALAGLVLAMAVVCLLSYGDAGPPRWYQAALSLSAAGAVVAGASLTGQG